MGIYIKRLVLALIHELIIMLMNNGKTNFDEKKIVNECHKKCLAKMTNNKINGETQSIEQNQMYSPGQSRAILKESLNKMHSTLNATISLRR